METTTDTTGRAQIVLELQDKTTDTVAGEMVDQEHKNT